MADADAAPAAPATSGIGIDDLMKLAAQLTSQQQAPPPAQQPIDLQATRPPSLLGRIGEALAGGPPSDYPMSAQDRDVAGHRALMNFGIGLMSAGPFQSIGQTFAGGLAQAQSQEDLQEAVAVERQAAAQDYQQQQLQNRLGVLKEALPLLQYQMAAGAAGRALGGGDGGGGGGGGGGPGSDIYSLPKADFLKAVAQRESGGDPTILNYVAQQDPTAYARGATASGKYQMVNSTWQMAAKLAGIDTTKYPTAMSAPEALQDKAASALYDKAGTAPWNPASWKQNWVKGPSGQYTLQTAPYQPPPGRAAPAAPAGPPAGPPAAPAPQGGATASALPLPPENPPGAVPTVTTPAEATATAKAAGSPVQVPGTQGLWATPQGNLTSTPHVIMPGTAVASLTPAAPAPAPTPATPAPAPAAPTPTPTPQQYPDVTSGDVTIRHPGDFAAFNAANRQPVPTDQKYNPDLTAADNAGLEARRQAAIAQLQAGNPQEALKINAEIAASRQQLLSQRQQDAATATADFNSKETDRVQKLYDAQVKAYTDAAQSKFTFHQDVTKNQADAMVKDNQELLKPFVTGAASAQQVLPNIDIAKQILPNLPTNASPWLANEENAKRLEVLAPYMPEGWKQSVESAGLFRQVMGQMVSTMGQNIESGQPGARQSAYEQFQTMLPSLSQSAQGREMALVFMQELAQRRLQQATFLQEWQRDPAHRDPNLGVPNMTGSLTAMDKALGPMVRLPPAGMDPNEMQAGSQGARDYLKYFNSVKPGGRYFTWTQGDDGKQHPQVLTKVPGQPPGYQE